jgi:hypothetical protein
MTLNSQTLSMLASKSALVMAIASTPAYAQNGPVAASAAQEGVAADIVVTARRKDESLQDVPQTVDAGDCREFRVWAGIMGKKETLYVTTQGTLDSGSAAGPIAGRV